MVHKIVDESVFSSVVNQSNVVCILPIKNWKFQLHKSFQAESTIIITNFMSEIF